MSQNDDKNKKDPEQDPFNFFKLSPEPSKNNKDQKKIYNSVIEKTRLLTSISKNERL